MKLERKTWEDKVNKSYLRLGFSEGQVLKLHVQTNCTQTRLEPILEAVKPVIFQWFTERQRSTAPGVSRPLQAHLSEFWSGVECARNMG